MNIELTLIEAERNTPERDTVVELGGASMVPFLVDSNVTPEVRMYESDDIIAYLEANYATHAEEA
jgi:glutathione S-transferase